MVINGRLIGSKSILVVVDRAGNIVNRNVPGEMVEKDNFHIGLNSSYEFNIENMKEYDVTDKFKDTS